MATGKGKVKAPDVFDGDPSKTNSFLDQIFLLFLGEPGRYTSDEVCIATALSYIDGDNVLFWKQRKIEQARYGEIQTWEEFEHDFRSTFSPLNESNDALLALQKHRMQTGWTIREFNARFNYLIGKSGISDDKAALAFYRQALPAWLRRLVSTSYPVPHTVEEWIHRTAEVYTANAQDQALAGTQPSGRRTYQGRTSQKKVRRNQLGTTDEAEVSASADVNRMTTEERSRHLKDDLCFNCHQAGHQAKDCPRPRPKQPIRKSMRKTPRKVRQVTETSDNSSAEDTDEEGDLADDEQEQDNLQIDTIHADYSDSDF